MKLLDTFSKLYEKITSNIIKAEILKIESEEIKIREKHTIPSPKNNVDKIENDIKKLTEENLELESKIRNADSE